MNHAEHPILDTHPSLVVECVSILRLAGGQMRGPSVMDRLTLNKGVSFRLVMESLDASVAMGHVQRNTQPGERATYQYIKPKDRAAGAAPELPDLSEADKVKILFGTPQRAQAMVVRAAPVAVTASAATTDAQNQDEAAADGGGSLGWKIAALLNVDDLTNGHLAERLKTSTSAISYHTKKMEAEGKIAKDSSHGAWKWIAGGNASRKETAVQMPTTSPESGAHGAPPPRHAAAMQPPGDDSESAAIRASVSTLRQRLTAPAPRIERADLKIATLRDIAGSLKDDAALSKLLKDCAMDIQRAHEATA